VGKRLRLKPTTDSLKLEIVLRQNCRCAYCNRPLLGLALEWDHIIPHVHLTTWSQDNWAASCHDCNIRKHGSVMDENGLYEFISSRMSVYGDIGEEAPEGHVEYWKRYFYKAKLKTNTSDLEAMEHGE